ncbi:hypothetical protein [Methanosarcina sp. KYL-1]|nr:hypothetical protein [Methanosarcina sp. KYL-1]
MASIKEQIGLHTGAKKLPNFHHFSGKKAAMHPHRSRGEHCG